MALPKRYAASLARLLSGMPLQNTYIDCLGLQFAIRPVVRGNSKFNRDLLIKTIAQVVGPGHSVDLKNYDLLILVEVVQVRFSPERPILDVTWLTPNIRLESDWNERSWA